MTEALYDLLYIVNEVLNIVVKVGLLFVITAYIKRK